MQEEVTQKTIAFSIKSAKLTIQVLQAAARKFLETQNKGKTKLHHGQQSLKQLKKHGAALSNIEITDANIGLFKPCAKKYGVDFTLRKDATTQPPHYIVIFKAKDADNMEQAFKEFTAKKLQREERPSIRKNIAASKEKAAARNADRAKEFTAKKLQREERPSIRKNIAASKEKAAARNADRAKEKFKERGLSR